MKLKTKKVVAVIDIGSTAMRLVIAEVDPTGEWRRLDRAFKPINLGRDVFMTGSIRRDTTLLALRILSSYLEMLKGWRIPLTDVRVIATAAIREARNRDTFVDRVYLRTGLRINIVEGIEENHLTYLAVQHAVKAIRGTIARTNTVILEVGGGTTEIMLLQRGKMVAAHSLRIGTVRIEQHMNPSSANYSNVDGYIRENVRNTKELLDAEFELDRIRYFMAVGGDARLCAHKVGTKVDEHFSVVEKGAFLGFVERLQKCTVDECVKELQITYNEAEGLVPALLVYKYFLNSTQADQVIVPDVSIRDGVIINFALGMSKSMERHFYSQVVASAVSLGRKYRFDEKHGTHVAGLALSIFDQFSGDHGLGHHERLLLEVAGLLHDVGNYVQTSGHHKHGQYLIANSEIFGLSGPDIRIVSNVVRYHRKGVPVASHIRFISLRREERITVLKLVAMLRVADGLDRGHSQRVKDLRLEKNEDELIFRLDYSGDPLVERTGLRLKAEMFEEVFGYRIRVA